MVPKSIFPSVPLSLEAIKLGRLVTNTRYPQQDYIDPAAAAGAAPEFTRNALLDFEEIRSSARASNLRTRLASLLSMTLENRDEYLVDFSAASSFTYTLNNSRAWFNAACSSATSRKWLEDAIEINHNVYLVVGYHTLVDARVTERAVTMEAANLKAGVQIMGVGMPGVGGFELTTDVGGGGGRGHKYQRIFAAPGEHIYAVQYRKIRFNWYSSRSVKTAFLEPNNRWKPCVGVRGELDDGIDDVVEADIMEDWSDEDEENGEDEEEEEEGEEEEEEEEEEDGEEGEGGAGNAQRYTKSAQAKEKYVTESGETEFVF